MARQKHCTYCMEELEGRCNESIIKTFDILKLHGMPIVQGELFIVDGTHLELYIDDCTDNGLMKKKVKIKYCPMCGRRLKDGKAKIRESET